jgi:hypothetical protein
MRTYDHWDRLRSGRPKQVKQALRQLEQEHAQEPHASNIMELGVAYMWVRSYDAASKHFRLAIDRHPTSVTDFHGMAGAAKWCLGEFDEAVRQWVAGLKADFADTAGLGVQLPLLLFTASVLKPETFERIAAETILAERAEDPRITEWPGPVASWLLTQISDSEFRNRCTGDDEPDTLDRHWLAEFYRGVLLYGEGKSSDFKATMRKLTDTARPQWSDETFFLARMWSEEFFLARREAC